MKNSSCFMRSKIILLSTLIICIAFSSCKKIENEIVGTWYYQTYQNVPQDRVVCKFLESGDLVVIMNINGNISTDTAKYYVTQTAFKKQIRISESKDLPGLGNFNGIYKVYKYKSDKVKMNRISFEDGSTGGHFKRVEMIRE